MSVNRREILANNYTFTKVSSKISHTSKIQIQSDTQTTNFSDSSVEKRHIEKWLTIPKHGCQYQKIKTIYRFIKRRLYIRNGEQPKRLSMILLWLGLGGCSTTCITCEQFWKHCAEA